MDQTIRYSIERHKAQEKRRKIIRRERMHVKMLLLLCFISCLLPSISFDVVQASGVFELELIKLTETRPDFRESPANDSLSRAPVTTPATLSADPTTAASAAEKLRRVFVCLKEAFTSQPIDGPCTFGNASIIVSQQQQDSTNQSSTQTLTTAPTVATDEQQQQQGSLLTNIVRIPITFKWTKSFTIILSVEEPTVRQSSVVQQQQLVDSADNQLPHRALLAQQPTAETAANGSSTAADSSSTAATQQLLNETASIGIIVDRHMLTENEVIPDLEINSNKPWTIRSSRGLKSSLVYRYRLYCALNYYGDGCNTFCRSRDDQFGHYKCSPSGQKICLDGWQGQENNCLQAKCLAGCQTGQCDSPGTCKCRAGWTGARCDQCLTYPGCQNGYCLLPGQCLCHQNWGGVLCDQDLNYCSTHEPCKNNATCQNVAPGRYKCNCPDGYTGVNCDLSTSRLGQPLQQHHQQQQHQQQQPTAGCALNPCLNGGVCFRFNADKLASSSSSSSPPPPNRTRRHYRCQCTSGWTGDYCQWPELQLLSSGMISISSSSSSDDDYDQQTATSGKNLSDGSSLNVSHETQAGATSDEDASTLGADPNLDSPGDPDEARIISPPFIENPSLGLATVATTTTTTTTTAAASPVNMDMRHIISGVVVASAMGVFMAALLLAWCCLAAFERNGFSFIQMNIIRGADSSQANSDAADQAVAVRTTLRRMQKKIRNSFRCPSLSSKRHIKPETKLSIENVLRAPPSYEESKYYHDHPDYLGVVVVSGGGGCVEGGFGDTNSKLKSMAAPNVSQVEVEPDEKPVKSNSLVIRGAIEQKLLQVSSSNKSKQITTSANPKTSNHQQQSPEDEIMTNRHISTANLNCPKHGHLYRMNNKQPYQQPIRAILNERDLKISYPNEIVIRAEDLYEDHSALR